MQKSDYSNYILPIGLVVILYAVAKKFGLVPDMQKEKTEKAQFESNFFAPDYLQKLGKANPGKKIRLLTQKNAAGLALALKNSKGIFNDDENKLFAVVRAMQTKSQVWQLAQTFNKNYKADLYTFFQSFLNENEIKRIFDYWNELPTGIV